jgi:superoxide reductase
MRNQKFYICSVCGNLVGKIEDGRAPMSCCGQKMQELVPNTVEASGEKHLPVYTLKDNLLEVSVGSVLHPMSEAHHIAWIYVETEDGGQRKILKLNNDPKISFRFVNDKPLSIFAYCNLHGLWKTEIK